MFRDAFSYAYANDFANTLRKRVPIFPPDTPSPYVPDSQTPEKKGTPQTPTSHIS